MTVGGVAARPGTATAAAPCGGSSAVKAASCEDTADACMLSSWLLLAGRAFRRLRLDPPAALGWPRMVVGFPGAVADGGRDPGVAGDPGCATMGAASRIAVREAAARPALAVSSG